jgi:hypothetical protein
MRSSGEMLRRWLRSKFFSGRRVIISSGVPSVLLESSSPPAFLSASAELAAQRLSDKNRIVCFTCGVAGHKKSNCPSAGATPAAPAAANASEPSAPAADNTHDAAQSPADIEAAESTEAGDADAAEATAEDLRNSTMALWDMPYDQQIAAKQSCLLQSLGAVTTAFLNQVT